MAKLYSKLLSLFLTILIVSCTVSKKTSKELYSAINKTFDYIDSPKIEGEWYRKPVYYSQDSIYLITSTFYNKVKVQIRDTSNLDNDYKILQKKLEKHYEEEYKDLVVFIMRSAYGSWIEIDRYFMKKDND